jgi:hypothetical protein
VVARQIYEELAWADVSVAWSVRNNQRPCLTSRYFSTSVRTTLFGEARQLFANSIRPTRQAVVVDGEFGFRGSGRWSRAVNWQTGFP